MPYKKKVVIAKKKRVYKKKSSKVSPAIVKYVKKELNKNIETKKSVYTSTDGVEIGHNGAVVLDNTLLYTSQGVTDPQNNSLYNRVGDEINLRGVELKFMFELNERYSDVTLRIIVVKSAKYDVPTATTLFNGISGNKMLDTFNTERYTIIAQKYLKITAPNTGAITTLAGATNVGSGIYDASTTQYFSRATKLCKMWIPASKIVGRSAKVVYENQTGQPKMNDYHVIVYAYSNYSTSDALGWYVARVNDFIKTIYYKDA